MASAKAVAGIIAAVGLAGGVAVTTLTGPKPPKPSAAKVKKNVPKNAAHLWAKQPDGGTLLRDPLPTLDDGGCQAWATRCADGICRGTCE